MMLSMQFILLSVIPLALASRDAYQEKIFQMHNEYRKQILECKVDGQPAAKRMPPLIWDEELASQAEALSKSCTFTNNNPTSRKYNPVGQNIASCGTVEDVMKRWFGQQIWYNFTEHKCSPYRRCRQYMQMVFENTTHIGCAVTECPFDEKYSHALFIVCNYGPGAKFYVRPYEAKNIKEVCPLKGTTVAAQPEHGQPQPMKYKNRNKPRRNKY
ncbi:unnamed protein product [Trichobilharzia szidati]|nr:unnamed protein product [Trichobilharzia szidati]